MKRISILILLFGLLSTILFTGCSGRGQADEIQGPAPKEAYLKYYDAIRKGDFTGAQEYIARSRLIDLDKKGDVDQLLMEAAAEMGDDLEITGEHKIGKDLVITADCTVRDLPATGEIRFTLERDRWKIVNESWE